MLEKPVTHTQTTADGSVVVVTGVPATVVTHLEVPDEVSYSLEVAERLEQLISDALASAPGPGAQVFVRWEAGASLPAFDLELRFRGPEASLGSASINFWEKMTGRVNSAFAIVARSLSKVYRVNAASPQVAFVGPGSLRVGLRSRHMEPMFEGPLNPDEVGFEALRVIVGAASLLDGQLPDDSLLRTDSRVAHAALRALEALTPNQRRQQDSVELIPSPESFPLAAPTLLTSASLSPIRAARMRLSTEDLGREEVVLDGQIQRVSADGTLHMRNVVAVEGDWRSLKTAEVAFSEDHFADVVEHFRDQVTIRLYGYRSLGPGSSERKLRLTAIDVAPVQDDE